ncbi:MAG: hypothetical protein KDB27_12500 [Planctomycetales bacterium]|nr:hypothetical protein [Planctomycetales bacterium]
MLPKKDGSSFVVSLRHRTNLIGSAEGCRVRLRSKWIAPLHAVITRDPTGLQVRKLDPEARLDLNGQPTDVSYLRDGDQIRVGPIAMEISTNVKPVDSKSLLEEFAQHIKTQLSITPTDYEIAFEPHERAQQNGRDDLEKQSEAVHRWKQLSDQLEQQERLLSKVERQLKDQEESSNPEVHRQVQQMSELHERIRNEISVLRLWLRPTAAAEQLDSEPEPTAVPDQPQRPRQKVILRDHCPLGDDRVAVNGFTCRNCSHAVFRPRELRWFELPAFFFYRGVECEKCDERSIHPASKIKPLDP